MEYEEVSNKEWEKIVLKSDHAYFFHSPLWAKIMEKTYNYRTATRLYEINGKEILVPLMKKKKYGFNFLSSMPFYSMSFGYGGFFSKSSLSSDEIKNLIHQISSGRNIIFDFTMPPLSGLPLDFEDTSITKINDYWSYTHILRLNKNFDYIWKNKFKKRARRAIRKAVKNGVEIRKGDSLDDFKALYDIYSRASQKWGYKNPPISFDFFLNVYKYGSDHVELSLATKDDKIIAGRICFRYSKTVYGYLNAFLPEYGTFNPTSLLISESIKQACDDGFKYVDVGSSGNNLGLKKFKESFGSEIIKTNTFRAYSLVGRMGSNIYKIVGNFH